MLNLSASIAVIGDSGSTGYGVRYSPGLQGPSAGLDVNDWEHKPDAWVYRLRLAYPGYRLHNFAVNGSQATHHIDRLDLDSITQVAQLQPSLLLVALGINDRSNGRGPRTFGGDLEDIIDQMQTHSPGTRIVLIAEWNWGDDATQQEQIAYWRQTSRVAHERQTGLVEWYKILLPPSLAPRGSFSDDIHPDGPYQRQMATMVISYLKQTWPLL